MKVKLVAWTPNLDLIAGAAARGCLSKKSAAELLESEGKEKLKRSLRTAIERGHYSVLEHNRALWLVEGIEECEILQLPKKHKFLEISKVGNDWVLSANLRSVLELAQTEKSELVDKLVESMCKLSPTLAEFLGRFK